MLYTDKFKDLVKILKLRTDMPQALKEAVLAKAIFFTNAGKEELFLQGNNFSNILWADSLGVKGVDKSKHFMSPDIRSFMIADDLDSAVDYYMQKLRLSRYSGWGNALANGPEAFLEYIDECDSFPKTYLSSIISFIPEARTLLLERRQEETNNIGIIIGHDSASQGAVSYNGFSEYEYNLDVSDYLAQKIKNLYIFTKKGLDYTHINKAYQDLNINFSLELHFNSYNKVARGLEMLILSDALAETTEKADKITDTLSEELGITERHGNGLKVLQPYERGAVCLTSVSCKHKMLVEPCFGNTKNPDSIKLFETGGVQFYGNALISALKTHAGAILREEDQEEPNVGLKEIIKRAISFTGSYEQRIKTLALTLESLEEEIALSGELRKDLERAAKNIKV